MQRPGSISRLLRRASPAAAAALLSCQAPEDAPGPGELRARFPLQAALVLERGASFVARGSALAPVGGGPTAFRHVEVALPADGAEAVRLRVLGRKGLEVRVRELGAYGPATPVEQAVAYRRAGGTSYWTAAGGGVENWLHLGPAATGRGGVVGSWEVLGAALRPLGDRVEVVDAGGVAVLEVRAPHAYGTGGRELSAHLSATGSRLELTVDAGGEEVLVDPVWTLLGTTLNRARAAHTASRLPSGQVLAAGGRTLTGGLPSAEVFDPLTLTWTLAPPMPSGHWGQTATLAQLGGHWGLMIVGGFASFETDVYTYGNDPMSYGWVTGGVAELTGTRIQHTSTVLPDGTVLLAGGNDGGTVTASTSIFTSKGWGTALPMTQPRALHTATLLTDGTVLVLGSGSLAQGATSPDLYRSPAPSNPIGSWSAGANAMHAARASFTATLLPDGTVLAAGGNVEPNPVEASAEVYDPVTTKFTTVPSMSTPRFGHTATLLPDGRVLVAGGRAVSNGPPLKTAEIFDPVARSWSAASSMNVARVEHTATVLGDGSVLLAGGTDAQGAALTSAEVFAQLASGSACTLSTDCLTGFCEAGLCCDSACVGTCLSCALAGSEGTCAPMAKGTTCDGTACSTGGVCDGNGACASTPVVCAPLDACHTAGVCEVATGQCTQPAKPNCVLPVDAGAPVSPSNGAPGCASDKECGGARHCSRGVCCDAACLEPCHSCALPGSVGTCVAEPEGVDLYDHCGIEANCLSTCKGDAAGTCIGAGKGTQCLPSSCDADGVRGEGAAFCPSEGSKCPEGERVAFDCTPYRCAPALGACVTSCSTIDECAPPFVCDPTGTCSPAPDEASGSDSGCGVASSLARGSGGDAASPLALLALVASRARRRRRSPDRPSS